MTIITLYTGGGVSLSPKYIEGRTESKYVRLIADEGRAISNGAIIVNSIDVLKEKTNEWYDTDAIDEPTEEEFAEAGRVMMGYEHS